MGTHAFMHLMEAVYTPLDHPGMDRFELAVG